MPIFEESLSSKDLNAGLTIAENNLPFCLENFFISLTERPIKADM